ncbi:hypothetical protein GGR53DRAFT_531131 [Hypoxylon sp. FL1150]|nr:hypothetical protein GGR53DRAFT_531131 [Hypoxylon sp. FL1150]
MPHQLLRSKMASPQVTRTGWPSWNIPVEIFIMIARYLPYREARALRLVNSEFNHKLMRYAFEQFVFSFGPELTMRLGSGPLHQWKPTPTDLANHLPYSRFLGDIDSVPQRIGLALDLDEEELAYPDIEDPFEIVLGFGGPYRYPRELNNGRYKSQLEKIKMLLEQPQEVARILPSMDNVREFSLSCEGGLGYLQGPDTNPLQSLTRRPAVFGDPDVARGTPGHSSQYIRTPYKLEMAHRELAAKGVDPKDFNSIIKQLLELEGTTMQKFLYEERKKAPLPEDHQSRTRYFFDDDMVQLQPEAFTDAQARFSFQHVATQQALVQSFLVIILDKGPDLDNLTKINLSRLPSYHIDLLLRQDIWSSLPHLEEVALGIIPDWRDLYEDQNTVSVRQVFPADAMPKVFELLNDYIGTRKHIKRLHFEWICGGELAPGCMQRNQNVLPAPFLKEHRKVIKSGLGNLLILPHISELSLKNCWFAPHVFYKIVRTMAKVHCLESIELETVSLSGRPTRARRFSASIPEIGFYPSQPPGPFQTPPYLSWSHIIDMLTPGPTIMEHLHQPLRITKELRLRKLVFKSCGYVTIPDYRYIVNQNLFLFPTQLKDTVRVDIHDATMRRNHMQRFVQVSPDRHLASIVPVLTEQEANVLRGFFGFRTGWDQVYSPELIAAAQYDCITAPGLGRFTGTIEHDRWGMEEEGDLVYDTDLRTFDADYDDTRGLERVMLTMQRQMGYH